MKKPTFTSEEVKAMMAGEESEEVKARFDEAENLEKFSGLRSSVETTIKENAAAFINDELSAIDIPDGVKEIILFYDLSPETLDFIVRSSGVKVTMAGEGAVSDEIIHVITKAQEAKAKNNNQPLSFLTKTLGDSRITHILAIRDFEGETGAKTQIEALYTSVEAKGLSEGVSEIVPGDKCRLTIKYSALTVDGEKAGWLAPSVSGLGSKVTGGGNGGGGERKKRVSAPDGYKSWQEFLEAAPDDISKQVLSKISDKYGDSWSDHISATNALRNAKHPLIIAADEQNGD